MGNQLFQYAAGRALASRLGTDLVVDDRILALKDLRPCRQHFNWSICDDASLPPMKSDGVLRYSSWRLFGRCPRFRREKNLGYNADFATWRNGSYLHGYWQSQKYFEDISETIRDDLRIVSPPSYQNTQMAAQIADKASVSLHIRRGDYLALAAHNVCTKAYYHEALMRIASTAGIKPHIFVFSDDPKWAQDNLPLPFEKTVIDFNGPEADYEDLRLMSLCKHNVIANSSFSWWGAWLNRNPSKIVAGPASWFGKSKMQNPDIFPARWLRVNVE